MRNLLLASGFLLLSATTALADPPDGFTRTIMIGEYGDTIGIVPIGDGRMLAYERGGIVWILNDQGEASEEPFLDLSEEVMPWRDHGLMGVTVDPEFLTNGFVYVLYVVDPYHLYLYGSPTYDPSETWTNMATIGRLTRYQATAESNFSIIDPNSRTVLIGETITTGVPILHQSHGLGSLFFGDDGSLLFSMGDSASYLTTDTGGQAIGGWIDEALNVGIMSEIENVGAFRSQLVDSLCGKIIRVDPATGDGLASNPYFDPQDPRAARSRVWALGLRNGFRCSLMKGTGSLDPNDGEPGVIVVNDVGWNTREETSLVPTSKINLGWPLFEGYDNHSGYWFSGVENPSAINPLADGICPENFRFRDLIQEERPEGQLFSNPCNPAWTEAEDAASEGLVLNLEIPGCTGSGSLEFDGSGNEWIQFNVDGDNSKKVSFGLRYSLNTESPAQLDMFVDNTQVQQLTLNPTPCSACWGIAKFDLPLEVGARIIRFQGSNSQGLLLDRLEISNLDFTEIPEDVPTFTHQRPLVDWSHFSSSDARVASTIDGIPVAIRIESPESPVEGNSFGGVCASGSVVINDSRWPEEYRGIYFADFYYRWIRLIQLDEQGNPVRIRNFDSSTGLVADLAYDETSGDMLAIFWSTSPIRYLPEPVITCDGDLNKDGSVDGGDMGLLLSAWETPNADLNDDKITNGADLGLLLGLWGPCTP